jgi:hypothetical protein
VLQSASVHRGALAALFCAAVAMSGCGSSNGSSPPPPGPTPPPVPPAGPLNFGAVVPLAVSPADGTAPAAAIDGSGVAAVLWSQTGLVPVAGQPALVNPYVAARENVAGDTWAATQLVESAAAGDAATDRTLDLQVSAPATGINAAWLRSPTGPANDRVRAARRETPNGWSFGNVAAGVAGVARSELVFAANDAGAQAVAWIEPVAGVPQVQLRVRRVGVADWSAPAGAVQGNPAGVAANPALAMDPAARAHLRCRQRRFFKRTASRRQPAGHAQPARDRLWRQPLPRRVGAVAERRLQPARQARRRCQLAAELDPGRCTERVGQRGAADGRSQ